jgi:ankyrin repeat protein
VSANQSRLHAACTKGDVEKVTQLLKIGADTNNVDAAGNTPLHVVCLQVGSLRENGCELAKLLLSYGANVNAISNNGFTPLHVAAFSNNRVLCNLLIENHADASIVSRSGFRVSDTTSDLELQDILISTMPRMASVSLRQRRESVSVMEHISESSSISPGNRMRVLRDRSISSPFLKPK